MKYKGFASHVPDSETQYFRKGTTSVDEFPRVLSAAVESLFGAGLPVILRPTAGLYCILTRFLSMLKVPMINPTQLSTHYTLQ